MRSCLPSGPPASGARPTTRPPLRPRGDDGPGPGPYLGDAAGWTGGSPFPSTAPPPRETHMDWLKRLLGSKGGTPPPDEPPAAPAAPTGEEEAALQAMIDAGFDARTEFFSRLGEVRPD